MDLLEQSRTVGLGCGRAVSRARCGDSGPVVVVLGLGVADGARRGVVGRRRSITLIMVAERTGVFRAECPLPLADAGTGGVSPDLT